MVHLVVMMGWDALLGVCLEPLGLCCVGLRPTMCHHTWCSMVGFGYEWQSCLWPVIVASIVILGPYCSKVFSGRSVRYQILHRLQRGLQQWFGMMELIPGPFSICFTSVHMLLDITSEATQCTPICPLDAWSLGSIWFCSLKVFLGDAV